ncbi:MAG TPA: IMP dehydrogenase [Thiothrix sp.]|nr:IMP dehydrogenase [Thiothrix sp.]
MRILEDALTFDDVLLVPAHSIVLPAEVDLKTQITRDIHLNIPLISAAMDTVTEARLAIAMAQEGGVGVLHKNMTIAQQADEVRKVKKFESGIITDPITVSSTVTVQDVLDLTHAEKISGVPVVDGNNLVGIVTARDLRFEINMDAPVTSVMTAKDNLVTVSKGASRGEVRSLLHKHRIEKVLVVDDNFHLCGLITVKDIQKSRDFPLASKDNNGSLIVAAAVGTGHGTADRVAALVEAGVDIIVVDTAHGHSQGVLDRVKWVKDHYPDVQVIGGNIATAVAARDLVTAGADAIKVGIGPGSICTTRMVTGVGVPQITALMNVAEVLKGTGIPFIADGGIRFSGDVAKALASGAATVMMGGMFAGTDESPGDVEIYQGRSYKAYRGMGSLAAMAKGSSDRYFQSENAADKLVPEGIEGRVPYKGGLSPIIHQILGGVRSSMGYIGCADLHEMRTKSTCVRISNAGVTESHVHDVTITKEPPNYRV